MTNNALLDQAVAAKLAALSVRHVAHLIKGGASDREINCPTCETARKVIVREYLRIVAEEETESEIWAGLCDQMRRVNDTLAAMSGSTPIAK